MKKSIKILLLTLLVFALGISNAKARVFEVNKETYSKIMSNKELQVNGLTYGGHKYGLYKYDFKIDGTIQKAFCLDPHKMSRDNYKVERILGDTSSSNLIKAYDAGIMEILKQSYESTDDESYAATSIAIRAFTDGLFGWAGDATIDSATNASGNYKGWAKKLAAAQVNLGIEWASKNQDLAKKATGKMCNNIDFKKCYENAIGSQSWYKDDNKNVVFEWNKTNQNTSSYRVMNKAQELFVAGLKKAAEVAEGKWVLPDTSLEINSNPEIIEKNEDYTKKYVYANLKFDNFDKNNSFIKNITYSCPNCNRNNITIESFEYYNPLTNDWLTLDSRIDILTAFNAKDDLKSGQLKMRLKINQLNSDEECQNTDFTISYDYFDPKLEYSGAVLYAQNNGENAQRFVILSKVSDEGSFKKSKTGSIPCSQTPCESTIESPVCSNNPEDSTVSITSNSNVRKCILNKTDEAGNSYKLGANTGVSNDYCSISCKEDFDTISLQNSLTSIKCGRSIKLESYIKGKKTCYVNGTGENNRINEEKFNEDIKKAQIEMIEAYDKYVGYKAASLHIKYKSETESCGGGSYDYYWIENYSYEGFKVASVNGDGTVNGMAVTRSTTENTEGAHFLTKKSGSDSTSCESNDKDPKDPLYDDCATCSGSSTDGKKSDIETYINDEVDKATEELEAKINNLNKIIYDYNSCTTGWINNYDFDQIKIKYSYDEYQSQSSLSSAYYDLLDEEDKYLEGLYDNGKELVNDIEVCFGNINDKYECLGTSLNIAGSADNRKKNNVDENGYNEEYKDKNDNGVFSDQRFIVCDTNGCEPKDIPISNATYVKKTVEKEQEYVTPTNFCQIGSLGRVTLCQNSSLTLTPLNNGLPVSQKNVIGGHFDLMIEGLGEFYDTGEYGRLIDYGSDKNSVIKKQVNDNTIEFDGYYPCKYETDCSDKECPSCVPSVCAAPGSCPWPASSDKIPKCPTCVFSVTFQISFKTISTTNFNSADRTYGYNWITKDELAKLNLTASEEHSFSIITDKAEETIGEITNMNESIYNDKDTTGSSLAFSIKLTPSVIREIREYNSNHENDGGYANDSLTCVNVTDKSGNNYVNCYSKLIDSLIEDADYQGLVNRLSEAEQREKDPAGNGYWTTWDTIRPNVAYNDDVIGGPAWK